MCAPLPHARTHSHAQPRLLITPRAFPTHTHACILPPSLCAPHLQYLSLVRELVDEGVYRSDRTGTGTFSMFGRQVRASSGGGGGMFTELLLPAAAQRDSRLEAMQKAQRSWCAHAARHALLPPQLPLTDALPC